MVQGFPPANRGLLTDARREMIIIMLAGNVRKVDIAKRLNIHEVTLHRWLREDPDIKKQADDLELATIQRLQDELLGVAFAKTEITSASKMQAITRLLDGHEEKVRRQSGEVNQTDVTLSIMHVCKILVHMPEAKEAILNAYRESIRSDHSGDTGPDDLPPKLPDGSDTGA